MINVERVWVPEILWYCDLIADRSKLLSAFNQKQEDLWTSVTGYDELSCQVFDDLDALNQLDSLETSDLPAELKTALAEFVRTFDTFDAGIEDFGERDLQTSEWLAVERSANAAVDAAKNWNVDA